MFPLTGASVNYKFTCYRLYFSHRDCGCVNLVVPARQNPPPSRAHQQFAGCSHVSRAVHSKSTQVLPAAASLVLLDPTELPAPKKEKCWRTIKLQTSCCFASKKRGFYNTTNTCKCSVSTMPWAGRSAPRWSLPSPCSAQWEQSGWCHPLNNTRRKMLPAPLAEQACPIPPLPLRDGGSKHTGGPGVRCWVVRDAHLE